ncbi:MAG: LiaI-LiaF-like domain-containing protein [Bacteroidales bacterium]
MKYRHVFWAFILIAIGVLFMLNNFGVLEFGFRALWSLWPLILILWGISILPIRDVVKIIALVGVLVFTIIFFNRISERSSWFHFNDFRGFSNKDWDEDEDTATYNYQPQNLSVPFDSLIGKGELKLEAAAGNFDLEGVTSDFLTFNKSGDIGNYSITTTNENGRKRINLSLEKSGIRHNVSENKVEIKLSEKPSWNLDFDIGAAEILMDLRDYKIDTTTINAGASSINIKIGDKNPLTVMTFNAGASSIKVDIPNGSGCQIKSESFMISKEFDGFTKKGDGIYQTDNFSTAKNKIHLTIKTAISKIEINRY